jgi:hypothetical protein
VVVMVANHHRCWSRCKMGGIGEVGGMVGRLVQLEGVRYCQDWWSFHSRVEMGLG